MLSRLRCPRYHLHPLHPSDFSIDDITPPLDHTWHHNGHHGVSNHQPHNLKHSFGRREKKTLMLCVRRIHQWPVNSPHKWPVTRKMCPLDYVIMTQSGAKQPDKESSAWYKLVTLPNHRCVCVGGLNQKKYMIIVAYKIMRRVCNILTRVKRRCHTEFAISQKFIGIFIRSVGSFCHHGVVETAWYKRGIGRDFTQNHLISSVF